MDTHSRIQELADNLEKENSQNKSHVKFFLIYSICFIHTPTNKHKPADCIFSDLHQKIYVVDVGDFIVITRTCRIQDVINYYNNVDIMFFMV